MVGAPSLESKRDPRPFCRHHLRIPAISNVIASAARRNNRCGQAWRSGGVLHGSGHALNSSVQETVRRRPRDVVPAAPADQRFPQWRLVRDPSGQRICLHRTDDQELLFAEFRDHQHARTNPGFAQDCATRSDQFRAAQDGVQFTDSGLDALDLSLRAKQLAVFRAVSELTGSTQPIDYLRATLTLDVGQFRLELAQAISRQKQAVLKGGKPDGQSYHTHAAQSVLST